MKKLLVGEKDVLSVIKSAKLLTRNMDSIMSQRDGVDRVKAIAKEINRFEFDLDYFLHFGLGIPLDRLRPEDIQKLKRIAK